MTIQQDLRAIADHIDANPGLDISPYIMLFVFATKDNFAEQMRLLGGTINAPAAKSADTKYLNVERKFGRISVQVTVPKEETCERVQVGTLQVERPVVIDTGEVETVDEPIYEYICPPAWSAIGAPA